MSLFSPTERNGPFFWPAALLDALLNAGILPSLVIRRSSHHCSAVGWRHQACCRGVLGEGSPPRNLGCRQRQIRSCVPDSRYSARGQPEPLAQHAVSISPHTHTYTKALRGRRHSHEPTQRQYSKFCVVYGCRPFTTVFATAPPLCRYPKLEEHSSHS